MSGCLIIPEKETAKARRELFGNAEQLDTISRQAAVEALNKTARDLFTLADSYEFYIKALLHAEAEILDLPSAQPYSKAEIQKMQELESAQLEKAYELGRESAQPELDEWCTDCKEYDKDRRCCPRYNRVIREALDDVITFHWTPVEDSLPIRSGSYLACNERGAVYTVFYFGNRWGTDGVIAWAELPEPYRKEGKHD